MLKRIPFAFNLFSPPYVVYVKKAILFNKSEKMLKKDLYRSTRKIFVVLMIATNKEFITYATDTRIFKKTSHNTNIENTATTIRLKMLKTKDSKNIHLDKLHKAGKTNK